MGTARTLFLALALVCFGFGCCARPAVHASHHAFAAQLESETVALVRLEDGRPAPYCAGVWVSPYVIVTAEHCVAFLGMSDERKLEHALGLDEDQPRWDPTGQVALYAVAGDMTRDGATSYRTGLVLSDDYAHDLAAVMVDPPYWHHEYARLGLGSVDEGDWCATVGHPAGYQWSYAEGVISAWRANEPGVGDKHFDTIQAEIALSGGNSGGGLFDSNGGLIGVASYMDGRLNGMAFFVHRDAVANFLRRAGAV